MRGGAADRIGRLDADREVDIGAIGTERVVAGKVQLGTRLPLSVSRRDDAIRQRRGHPFDCLFREESLPIEFPPVRKHGIERRKC